LLKPSPDYAAYATRNPALLDKNVAVEDVAKSFESFKGKTEKA